MRLRFILFLNILVQICVRTPDVKATTKYSLADDYFEASSLRPDDREYEDHIRTVRLHPVGFELGAPVYQLGSSEALELSFDDLIGANPGYILKVFLCDRYWNPYDIYPNEFLDGYDYFQIDNFESSFNTNQFYLHYSCTFPNEMMRPTRSGNYLLVVIDQVSNKPILSRRLFVTEQVGEIQMSVLPTVHIEERLYRQEVNFIVKTPIAISDPYDNLSATVLQNFRPDNGYQGLAPVFVKDTEYGFSREGSIVFNGLSEFRMFDTRSFRYNSERVRRMERDAEGFYDFWLLTDPRRRFRVYEFTQDIDGQYIVRADETQNPDIDADYVGVHFELDQPGPIDTANVFIMGKFTNWQESEKFMLKWDGNLKKYVLNLYLKQGYYNYGYGLSVKDKGIDMSYIEGNHSETLNTYSVLIYYTDITLGSDRIIAYRSESSAGRKF